MEHKKSEMTPPPAPLPRIRGGGVSGSQVPLPVHGAGRFRGWGSSQPTSNATDNSAFFAFWDKAGTFVLANLLWVACSLPLVTLPASTAALFAVIAPLTRGKQVEPFSAFMAAFREHGRKATIIGLVDVAVIGLIAVNVSIFGRMDEAQAITLLSQAMTVFAGIAVLMINVYLWVLLVTFDMPLRSLFDTALRLAFGHALWSLALLLMVGGTLLISALLPALFLVFGTASACALLITWGTWRVIQRYVPDTELARLELEGSIEQP